MGLFIRSHELNCFTSDVTQTKAVVYLSPIILTGCKNLSQQIQFIPGLDVEINIKVSKSVLYLI